MEVSPEIYAWLSALNIIDPFTETNKNGMSNYFIPENIVNSFFNGEYISLLILDLQKAYNKYHDIRKDCSQKLRELVFKEKNFDKISEKTKLNNWNVINDALKIFDIKYSKNELNKVVNGNNLILKKIIETIFNSVSQLLKYTKKGTNKDNNGLKINNKSIRDHLNLNMNFNTNQKSIITFNDSNNKIFQKENNITINASRNNNILRNFNKDDSSISVIHNNSNYNSMKNLITNNTEYNDIINEKNQNFQYTESIDNNIINNNNTNNINNDILNSKRPLTEYVDVNKLSEDTLYTNCTSTLEFFIVSLCKNFKIKPIQAIGLLSNNRQYLSVMCLSGINGNYISIQKWLEDLQINYDILLKLIFKYEDGVYMTYCIIGTALCSKNLDISIYALDLLSQLYKNVGINNDWFKKIGINSFIFTFIKHTDKILYFLNTMCEFLKNDDSIFFNEIKNKIYNDDEYKTLIFDILLNIIGVSKKIDNKIFVNNFKDFVFDICLHEEIKLTYSCSILCESFFYYYQIIDNNTVNKINLFFKKCIRNNNSNIYGSTISKIIVLINKLGRLYNQHAPPLYKTLVVLFIEMYDDLQKREIFLLNFENFLLEHKEMPLDILLEPYFNILKNTNNYNLCDFSFFSKILKHPRIEYNDILNIITFLLSTTFNNILFNKCAIFIMEKIFVDLIPNLHMDDRQMEDLSILFIDYISQAFEEYIMSQNNNYNENENGSENGYDNDNNIDGDKYENILEMAYLIIQNNFGDVNFCIKIKIIEVAKLYYDNYKKHSGILLGMLKKYDDFGNIIFEIEQEQEPMKEYNN